MSTEAMLNTLDNVEKEIAGCIQSAGEIYWIYFMCT